MWQILSVGDGGLLATVDYTYWISPRILQVITRTRSLTHHLIGGGGGCTIIPALS